MNTSLTRSAPDPLGRLTRRERRSWRAAERRVVAEHDHQVSAALQSLGGTPVDAVRALPSGAVEVVAGGLEVRLAGVADLPCAALSVLVRRPCHVAGAGRYGRFWWLAIDADSGGFSPRATVLGSRIVVTPSGSGNRPAGSGNGPGCTQAPEAAG
ncbi:MAG: hypothetical protein ACRDWW_04200 [Acidimicrobiales bacterium]